MFGLFFPNTRKAAAVFTTETPPIPQLNSSQIRPKKILCLVTRDKKVSTRIKKIIGWGGVHPDRKALNERLDDYAEDGEVERLVLDARRNAGIAKRFNPISLSFEARYPAMTVASAERYPKRLENLVRYATHPDNDGGHHIIMTPMMASSWLRVDDAIDYVEASLKEEPMKEVLKQLPGPIYPYLNWMNPITGELLKGYSHLCDRERSAEEIGCDPVPYVPEVIQIIAEELHFPDWKLLRPMFGIWWS
jgi:hypothetical protein